YMTKPFDLAELEARLQVAKRILDLQSDLAVRVRQLEAAISQVKELEGLLPICMYCKKIRNDKNFWEHLESYISARSKANFSHGICPSCFETVTLPLREANGALEKSS